MGSIRGSNTGPLAIKDRVSPKRESYHCNKLSATCHGFKLVGADVPRPIDLCWWDLSRFWILQIVILNLSELHPHPM